MAMTDGRDLHQSELPDSHHPQTQRPVRKFIMVAEWDLAQAVREPLMSELSGKSGNRYGSLEGHTAGEGHDKTGAEQTGGGTEARGVSGTSFIPPDEPGVVKNSDRISDGFSVTLTGDATNPVIIPLPRLPRVVMVTTVTTSETSVSEIIVANTCAPRKFQVWRAPRIAKAPSRRPAFGEKKGQGEPTPGRSAHLQARCIDTFTAVEVDIGLLTTVGRQMFREQDEDSREDERFLKDIPGETLRRLGEGGTPYAHHMTTVDQSDRYLCILPTRPANLVSQRGQRNVNSEIGAVNQGIVT
ncbi:hypothetical protein Bbelb_204410 [Branchiostoma belcheri]|nr:hypothetical protein Bbelb_204410 [Branchiostoma belcheri]